MIILSEILLAHEDFMLSTLTTMRLHGENFNSLYMLQDMMTQRTTYNYVALKDIDSFTVDYSNISLYSPSLAHWQSIEISIYCSPSSL